MGCLYSSFQTYTLIVFARVLPEHSASIHDFNSFAVSGHELQTRSNAKMRNSNKACMSLINAYPNTRVLGLLLNLDVFDPH